MASTTTNIGLTLPDSNENVSRQVINGNWTLIDTAFGSRKPIITETRTLNIPEVYEDTPVGTLVHRQISEVSDALSVIGYEILVSSDSDMTDLLTAPYSIAVSVIHNSNHGPDSHDWICIDVIQNQACSVSIAAMTVTIKTYCYNTSGSI